MQEFSTEVVPSIDPSLCEAIEVPILGLWVAVVCAGILLYYGGVVEDTTHGWTDGVSWLGGGGPLVQIGVTTRFAFTLRGGAYASIRRDQRLPSGELAAGIALY